MNYNPLFVQTLCSIIRTKQIILISFLLQIKLDYISLKKILIVFSFFSQFLAKVFAIFFSFSFSFPNPIYLLLLSLAVLSVNTPPCLHIPSPFPTSFGGRGSVGLTGGRGCCGVTGGDDWGASGGGDNWGVSVGEGNRGGGGVWG